MPELQPITREETLLDGGDLTPITREEMFIKRIYDKNQSVPEPITRKEYFLKKAGEGSGGDVTIEQLNVTRNGTYSESGKAYSPVVVNIPTPENAYLLESVEGLPSDIATFEASNLPMNKLKVSIEPQQDLHGYDAPWVGGAGKNKLPLTVDGIKAVNTYHSWSGNSTTINNVTITIETDSVGNVIGIKFNGTASADITFNLANNIVIPNGSYVLSNDQIVNISNLWLSLTSPNIAITLNSEKERNVIVSNGSIGSAYIYATSGNTFNNVVFKPMIRLASVSDATFAPYSNICPISGWTEVDVTRCGKNLLDPTIRKYSKPFVVYGGTIASNVPDGSLVLTAGTYTISINKNMSIIEVRDNPNSIIKTGQGNSLTFTLEEEKAIKIAINIGSADIDSLTFQLERGSTATTYEPYNGQTYTIDLDGTRYGGELDVVSGVLTLTHGYIASYNGETLPSTWISDRDVYAEGTMPTVGAQVVYKLATPLTIQLTPTQVKSLLQNNIWADTGEVLEAEYFTKGE